MRYKIRQPLSYGISWASFNNQTGESEPLKDAIGPEVPRAVVGAASGSFWSATISGEKASAVVYLRANKSGPEIVGIERKW